MRSIWKFQVDTKAHLLSFAASYGTDHSKYQSLYYGDMYQLYATLKKTLVTWFFVGNFSLQICWLTVSFIKLQQKSESTGSQRCSPNKSPKQYLYSQSLQNCLCRYV